jgi:hypothetical protein
MDIDRVRGFLLRLLSSTQARKLAWEETADENTFRLTLDAGMVHIEKLKNSNRILPSGLEHYRLSLLNVNGTTVEAFEGEEGQDFINLKQLYELARESALKPDDFLSNLEKEIGQRAGG